MAFSHRSRSHSAFLPELQQFETKRPMTYHATGITAPASARNAKTKSDHDFLGASLKKPLRPATAAPQPNAIISDWATEAHVQRIRSATSQANFKDYFRGLSLSGRDPAYVPTYKEPLFWTEPIPMENDDCDDVESVDWTAPFDITALLYKPEYVISRKQKSLQQNRQQQQDDAQSDTSGGKATTISKASLPLDDDDDDNTFVCKERQGREEISINCCPKVPGGQDNLMKADILCHYVKESLGTQRQQRIFKTPFERRVSDFTLLAKQLTEEMRELDRDTKKLDTFASSSKLWQVQSKEDLMSNAFKTLRRVYELNPKLTESAAKKYIDGPPGNPWMGLSRVEVLEVMIRVRQDFGVPQEEYEEDLERLRKLLTIHKPAPRASHRKKSKLHSKKVSSSKKKQQKSKTPRTPKDGSGNKFKKINLASLPMLHVPGPKHLHSNIHLRPWEPTLDGWDEENVNLNVNEIEINNDELPPLPPTPTPAPPETDRSHLRTPRSASGTVQKDIKSLISAPPPPPSRCGNEDSDNYSGDEDTGDEDAESFITVEIFNPIFRASR